MRNKFLIFLSLIASLFMVECKSGLVTTTNSCYTSIQQGEAANKAGNYSNALDIFNQVLQKCDAYDAKEKGYAGKAAAMNGMQQYSDALSAAMQGLAINKASIENLFEKAAAELGLNRTSDAKADFNTILDLSQKNRNIKERATIYAKMAEIDMKGNMNTDALNNIEQAIALDTANTSFYMLRGDIKAAQENFSDAIANYNLAISKGKDDAESWKARTTTYVKLYQKKYNLTDAQQLATKMSGTEKQLLCSDIQRAQSKGVKDMNMDLLQVSLCK